MERPPPNDNHLKDEYMQQTFRNQNYPKNEYEHAAMLLDSKMIDESVEHFKHSAIVDGYIQTSTINDDKVMNGLQLDLPFLHSMLAMSKRNKGLEPVFALMMQPWRSGILMTKAHQGMENLAQHATGAKHTPQPFGAGGYGAGLYPDEQQGKKKSIGEQIRGVFGGKKQ